MSNNVYVIDGANKTAEQVNTEIVSVLKKTECEIEVDEDEYGDSTIPYGTYKGYTYEYVGCIDTIELQNANLELMLAVSDNISISYNYYNDNDDYIKIWAQAEGQFDDLCEDVPESWEKMQWKIKVYCD